MQFLLLVAGVILLATHWFAGQHIVGLILVIAFAIATIFQLVAAHFARKAFRAVRSEMLRGRASRNRRGF